MACQAPLSMGFSRQEYWSGLPFLTPRDLPDPGIEPLSLASPALAGGRFFTTVSPVGISEKYPLTGFYHSPQPLRTAQLLELKVVLHGSLETQE